ncbi:hypothetical protein T07_9907 [Trichinella nelsoni]|uniref:Uncharacterized protein n=1 Tax=Trichinella nelsoni TaxID=6336 RepID=A0A0V0RSX8_9BILA|nr:hypothetical protein T07_9907 [Trichinella nelsoni]
MSEEICMKMIPSACLELNAVNLARILPLVTSVRHGTMPSTEIYPALRCFPTWVAEAFLEEKIRIIHQRCKDVRSSNTKAIFEKAFPPMRMFGEMEQVNHKQFLALLSFPLIL